MKKILCFIGILIFMLVSSQSFAADCTVTLEVKGGFLTATPEGPYSQCPGDKFTIRNRTGGNLSAAFRDRNLADVQSWVIPDNENRDRTLDGTERWVDFSRVSLISTPELRYPIRCGKVPALSTIGLIVLVVLVACSSFILWRRKIHLSRI
jgi:hypothetical protein